MDESRRYDNGYNNHHGTRIETQWAERNSQESMAYTTDKNLFVINDTPVLPIFPINKIKNNTLQYFNPPFPKFMNIITMGSPSPVLFFVFPFQKSLKTPCIYPLSLIDVMEHKKE